MKNISKGLWLGLALLLATSVFAANTTTKGSLQVIDPVTVSGTQLSPGDYSVKWEGKGPDVEVSILQGRKVVATTTARVVDLPQSPNNDSVVTTQNADGSKSLSEIRFGGKKYSLQVGQEAANNAETGASK